MYYSSACEIKYHEIWEGEIKFQKSWKKLVPPKLYYYTPIPLFSLNNSKQILSIMYTILASTSQNIPGLWDIKLWTLSWVTLLTMADKRVYPPGAPGILLKYVVKAIFPE